MKGLSVFEHLLRWAFKGLVWKYLSNLNDQAPIERE